MQVAQPIVVEVESRRPNVLLQQSCFFQVYMSCAVSIAPLCSVLFCFPFGVFVFQIYSAGFLSGSLTSCLDLCVSLLVIFVVQSFCIRVHLISCFSAIFSLGFDIDISFL